LRAQNDGVVSRKHLEAGHVDRQHVHADRPDDGSAPAANQYRAATGEAKIQASAYPVGIIAMVLRFGMDLRLAGRGAVLIRGRRAPSSGRSA